MTGTHWTEKNEKANIWCVANQFLDVLEAISVFRCKGVSLLVAQLDRFAIVMLVKKAQILCKSSFKMIFVHNKNYCIWQNDTQFCWGNEKVVWGNDSICWGNETHCWGNEADCWGNEAKLLGN